MKPKFATDSHHLALIHESVAGLGDGRVDDEECAPGDIVICIIRINS